MDCMNVEISSPEFPVLSHEYMGQQILSEEALSKVMRLEVLT